MSFFKNLFNKKDEPEMTSEPLDEDKFWEIIDKSLKNSSNLKEQEKFLIKEIEKLSFKEIIGFQSTCCSSLCTKYFGRIC